MAKKQRARIADADLFQTTEIPQESNDVETATRQKGKENKFKTTLYITPETVQIIDQAWLDLRRITGERLTRTDIIEAALLVALGDGEYGPLIDRLTSIRQSGLTS